MSPRILEYYISPCFPCAACLDWPPGRFVCFEYNITYLLLTNINVYVVKRNADHQIKSLYVASLAIKQGRFRSFLQIIIPNVRLVALNGIKMIYSNKVFYLFLRKLS